MSPKESHAMNKLAIVARFLLGLPYVVFGVNGLVEFLEPAGVLPPAADAFLQSLHDTGYMIELLAMTQIVGGMCVWIPRLVPLGLVVLAPVTVNIVLYHALLDPELSHAVIGYVLAALHLYLVLSYARSFTGLFSARVDPS
jgi:hypothetical protein